MNRLPIQKRAKIVQMLVEGSSVRATSRVTGHSPQTITKLIHDVGDSCLEWHHRKVRGTLSRKVQVDELWQFCYAKDKTLHEGRAKSPPPEAGTFWTWTAIEQHTKLMLSWIVSPRRTYEAAMRFIIDLHSRVESRIELSSDGLEVYVDAVNQVFGDGIDYGQVMKEYSKSRRGGRHPQFVKSHKRVITGRPRHITTSHVERSNGTIRKDLRRYTRRGTTASKTMEGHVSVLAIYFVYYNFCRSHMSLGAFTTPAMAAGLADEMYDFEWMIRLADGEVELPPRPNDEYDVMGDAGEWTKDVQKKGSRRPIGGKTPEVSTRRKYRTVRGIDFGH